MRSNYQVIGKLLSMVRLGKVRRIGLGYTAKTKSCFRAEEVKQEKSIIKIWLFLKVPL